MKRRWRLGWLATNIGERDCCGRAAIHNCQLAWRFVFTLILLTASVGLVSAVRALEAHGAWVEGLAFLAQGTRIATVGADQTVRLWDLVEAPKK